MANERAVLFIGAAGPIPGREEQAMTHWRDAGGWLDQQQKEGWFQRWDGFWLTAHGGDLNGAFICYGERAKLDEWRRTDAFEAWVFRASMCLQGLGTVPGVNYSAGKETMARREKAISKT